MKKHLFQVLLLCSSLLLLPSCTTRAQTHDPATQTAKPQTETIRDLIAAGNTEAALRLLVETGDPNAKLLQKQYDTAKDQYSKGLIDFAEWSRTQARINYALLEMEPEATTEPNTAGAPKAQMAVSRDTILYLVSEGNTGDALQLLMDAGVDDALLLLTRFNASTKQFSMGLIGYDEWARTQAQINYTMLELTPGRHSTETKTAAIPRDQIKKLAEAGKLEEALGLLFPAKPDDTALVLARIKTARKYYKLGTIDSENFDQIKAQVTLAVLEMSK